MSASMKGKRVDAYIGKSADVAKPILEYVRGACPEVEETIKWGFPHFMCRGMLCSMASCKQHCTFHFWRGDMVIDAKDHKSDEAMGQFGRIAARRDLPHRRVLLGYVRKAVQDNDAGVEARANQISRYQERTRRPRLHHGRLDQEQESSKRCSTVSLTATGRNMSDGSKPKLTRRGKEGETSPWSGWQKVSHGIGSMRSGDLQVSV